MAKTIEQVRTEIENSIKSNGKGEITGQVLQDALLSMLDTLMPATPSRDPMHFNYLEVGAQYNDTSVAIQRTDYYGNAISHQPGCWYLEGIGDLTNDEMRTVYEGGKWWMNSDNKGFCSNILARTNLPSHAFQQVIYKDAYNFQQAFNAAENLEVVDLRPSEVIESENRLNRTKIKTIAFMCQGSPKVKYIYGVIDASAAETGDALWIHTAGLIEVRLWGIKTDVKLPLAKNISVASILYMIENEAASSALTITLHADAYTRIMSYSSITDALAAHPKISIAKA